jgi:hypothetical protein
MDRRLIISCLMLLACVSIYAVTGPYDDMYDIDRSKCKFPFNYNGKTYTDCTTEGSNGDIPWCSVETDYAGVFAYCYRMDKPKVPCLSSYTVNGKPYQGCAKLTKTAPYLQCKTSNSKYSTIYCPNTTTDAVDKGLTKNRDCDSDYAKKSPDHTMW